MSKGNKKEQISLATSGDSSAELGDAPWLWVSAPCRAPACPAASYQGLEQDKGLAGQARKSLGLPFTHLMLTVGGHGPAWRALLLLRSQAEGRDVLHALTLCISSAGCRVPRSSVLSVTPSRLLETFGASTYEGPSGRAGPATRLSSSHPGGEERPQQKKDVLKFKEKTNQRLQTWTRGYRSSGEPRLPGPAI